LIKKISGSFEWLRITALRDEELIKIERAEISTFEYKL